MTRVFNGEATFLSPVLRPVERGLYWICGVDERREQHWLTYTVAMLLFHVGGFLIIYGLMRLQAVSAVQSGRAGRGRRRSLLQHRDLLHHQHQLAELRRRKHAVLSRSDGRPDAPELPVGGDRHRARGGADPRLLACLDAHGRQFLGRCDPLHALRAAADLHRLHAVPGLAGHAADARRLCRCHHAGRRQADHRAWSGGLAGRDQDARHQWRRLLQRQCRASVREPDGAVELRADHLDLRARRRADQRVRPHGRQPAPGLGHPRRDGRAVHRRRRRHLLGRGQRHHRDACAGAERRQHGRQGSPLRHRRVLAVRRRSPPRPPAAQSTPCTTRSPRSAA